jgi:hypothetical protein
LIIGKNGKKQEKDFCGCNFEFLQKQIMKSPQSILSREGIFVIILIVNIYKLSNFLASIDSDNILDAKSAVFSIKPELFLKLLSQQVYTKMFLIEDYF